MVSIITQFNQIQNYLLQLKSRYLLLSAIGGFFTVLVIIILVFVPTESLMSVTNYTIFDLQLAWTRNNVDTIINAWSSILNIVVYQTILDYIFIFGNTILFSSVFLLFTQRINSPTYKKFSQLGMWFSVVTGICDAVENLFTLVILMNSTNYLDIFPLLLSSFAALKFLALICEIILLGISLLVIIIGNPQKYN